MEWLAKIFSWAFRSETKILIDGWKALADERQGMYEKCRKENEVLKDKLEEALAEGEMRGEEMGAMEINENCQRELAIAHQNYQDLVQYIRDMRDHLN